MIAIIFEVIPAAGRKDDYLEMAAEMRHQKGHKHGEETEESPAAS